MSLATGVKKMIPPTQLSRRLALQSMLFSTGNGAFNTGSAVYFTQIIGLTAAQVGLGLTIAGVVSFVVAYPAGKLVDRIGARYMWAGGTILGAATFAFWPFIHGFTAYLAVSLLFEVLNNLGYAGYNAYVLDVLPEKERVETQAHLYSALNLGFTLGAIIGGVTLAFNDNDVLRWIPYVSVVLMLFNSASILRLPRAPHERVPGDATTSRRPKPTTPSPLRNPGWLFSSFFQSIIWSNQVLLNIVIPLWLVQETDSPHWLLAWLFGTNTVLCIFLPAYTSKGVNTISDALRRARYATGFFVVSCAITMITHSTAGFITALLVWLGHVTVTGAELAIGSASWAFQAKLMDPTRRGEYGGAAEVTGTLGRFWAPAVFTWLALSWKAHWHFVHWGWVAIAAICVVGMIGLHPAGYAAERFAIRHFEPEPDELDELAAEAAAAPDEPSGPVFDTGVERHPDLS